jgi:hypothetical protein
MALLLLLGLLVALDLVAWRWSTTPATATTGDPDNRAACGRKGGTMSQSSDPQDQHHADPVHVTPDGRNDALADARRWVRRKRIFATIVAIYLALSLMWFVIDMLDDSSGLWFYWPMLGAGLAVVITGIGLFGLGGLFGADWERRQIDKYLERRSDRERAGRWLLTRPRWRRPVGNIGTKSHAAAGGGYSYFPRIKERARG